MCLTFGGLSTFIIFLENGYLKTKHGYLQAEFHPQIYMLTLVGISCVFEGGISVWFLNPKNTYLSSTVKPILSKACKESPKITCLGEVCLCKS